MNIVQKPFHKALTCFFVLYTAINYALKEIEDKIIQFERDARHLNNETDALPSEIRSKNRT